VITISKKFSALFIALFLVFSVVIIGLIFHLNSYKNNAEAMTIKSSTEVLSNIDSEIKLLLEEEVTNLQALRVLLPMYEARYNDLNKILEIKEYHPITHPTSAPFIMDILYNYFPTNEADEQLLEILEKTVPYYQELKTLHLNLSTGSRNERIETLREIQYTNNKMAEVIVNYREAVN
jgi:hypothetical protein